MQWHQVELFSSLPINEKRQEAELICKRCFALFAFDLDSSDACQTQTHCSHQTPGVTCSAFQVASLKPSFRGGKALPDLPLVRCVSTTQRSSKKSFKILLFNLFVSMLWVLESSNRFLVMHLWRHARSWEQSVSRRTLQLTSIKL